MTAMTRRATNPAASDHTWRDLAACQNEDPELFFPPGEGASSQHQINQATSVCARCPVREACLQWALDTRQDIGVWGGLSEGERRSIHRRANQLGGYTRRSSVVDQILTSRLEEFRAAAGAGLDSAGIAKLLGTNVITVKKVEERLAQQDMAVTA
ncbi:WhiB family transcriptional regulator [Streptomyces sp. NPDC008150]|uniref:WhiB family transcriptional regulator n=1 Tax=Streptomyces sp. NPDC008150 TaxID=3364816 RepID=UPI0036EABBD3